MAQRNVTSHLNAQVWSIEVAVGDRVEQDDTLIVLEAMKTEIPVSAPASGIVRAIAVAQGDQVSEGQALLTLE